MTDFWSQAKDLNFGEISQVVHAAQQAANDKVIEIRKAKFKAQTIRVNPHNRRFQKI